VQLLGGALLFTRLAGFRLGRLANWWESTAIRRPYSTTSSAK
jgi:hypothetical protein